MVRVTHKIGAKHLSGEGDSHFLLTNKKGNYLSLGLQPNSHYDGYLIHDAQSQQLFKILQDISVEGDAQEIINELTVVRRERTSVTESFSLSSTALFYDVSAQSTVHFDFDCRRINDTSTEKRIYTVTRETVDGVDALHIHYTKYVGLVPQYTKHCLLLFTSSCELVSEEWKPVSLPYDALRGEEQERWVYRLTLAVPEQTQFILVTSSNLEKAREKAKYVLHNQESILLANKKYVKHYEEQPSVSSALVQHALDSLVTKRKDGRGIFAGLPWFYQYWMRDEAIALSPLITLGHYSLAKEILLRWVQNISEQKTTAHTTSTLGSADGPGLIARQLLKLCTQVDVLTHYFTQEELEYIYTAFVHYLHSLHFSHGLVLNETNETWMDTNPYGDGREGCRIEIQTLTLCIYDLLSFLGKKLKKETFHKEKQEFEADVKRWFYDKRGWLLDGFYPDGTPDARIRPNIFLAWYAQPKLFSREEWTNAFDHAVNNLFLTWGGFASITPSDEHFSPKYTGAHGTEPQNKSYHHGDSWYFLNNIAAMALFSVNPHKYHDSILKLQDAALADLLFSGYVGHASEVSSAAEQKPGGCFAQAWSASTLLEFLLLQRS